MVRNELQGSWALILGASSGFGAAAARVLAAKGVNIFGVHLDRKAALPEVESLVAELRRSGVQVHFENVNAADAEKRQAVVETFARAMGDGPKVRVFLHSLAFGALKPYLAPDGQFLTKPQLKMTVSVMAHTLVYWTQALVERGFLERDGRIFAMTSSGGHRVWPNYGAVSAAKAALESHIRQLALELAPHGITANSIRAGVTDTPALRKIPGHTEMMQVALARNPTGRLTTPEDVAATIGLLAEPESYWLNGNVLGVDGGEDVVG